jgi:hypothetical protein
VAVFGGSSCRIIFAKGDVRHVNIGKAGSMAGVRNRAGHLRTEGAGDLIQHDHGIASHEIDVRYALLGPPRGYRELARPSNL